MSVDVLVIGGGPAGLYAAWRFSQAGFSTLVCEEHAAIGTPVHCTGVLSAASFDEFPIPREAILNPLTTVQFVSPTGLEMRYTPPTLQAVVIDRAQFDQRLAGQALAAGAEIRFDTRVSSLEITPDAVVANAGGMPVRARLAVLACGASYTLQRRLGLGLPRAYLQTAQRELPARTLGDVVIQFGSAVAPGGFAWAVPIERPDGPHVRVGVMATGQTTGWYDAMVGRLASWGVQSDGARPRLKFLPLRSISRTFGDRLLVVGDAAGLVKPTTGGGIYYSIVSAVARLRRGRTGVAPRPPRACGAVGVSIAVAPASIGRVPCAVGAAPAGRAHERSSDRRVVRAGPFRRRDADRAADGELQPASPPDQRAAAARARSSDLLARENLS